MAKKNSDDKIVSVKKDLEILTILKPMPGKSPDGVLIIQGLSTGMVKLTIELKRSWENKPEEIKVYKITVR
ncbi:MAG: hypothetical protein IPL55_00320 [Saprospiraceae bacterium]|nr:hypothetical protein [Saprospiraceae bacterium]